ncbi:putative membrane protein [Streptoalloteichus tenebrarius]|uniref:Membrane protein n=1 Tax=Streptoalloteichus tenebrarius (strain ATCC 17920 / DSM 40477 / JCM 4838 / CBS 697.72 / NBRC 16177 / NCIMB 11028 / NRRL B-12390 / A12253. 1 / ISP 5477) TaxID=1933 RepID=A0ABT1HMB9_STRSD|nr:anthrone oxygenase family protein [Streptoalloteichus tenebrarius]MCP2256651.1 putative membrane protein [Streptoalloteichus tenebrarius]BFF05005.1 DUF1772 domain-containing protein [Streptoalloteichus tenebrarius]
MAGLLRYVTLIAAVISTGLVAGLFYAFAIAVMPGLAKVDDRAFVSTMQSINRVILNGWFLVAFVGTLVLTAGAALFHLDPGRRGVLLCVVLAFALSLATWAITMVVNVPLNNALEAAGDPDQIGDLAAVRERFEAVWVRWNIVRAVTSTAAFGCLVWALVLLGRVRGVGD